MVEGPVNWLTNLNEEQKQQAVARGVRPENLNKHYQPPRPPREPGEGYRSAFPVEYYERMGKSPISPTPTEYKNIIFPFDPTAKVVQIDPENSSAGLIIKSIYNPKNSKTGEHECV